MAWLSSLLTSVVGFSSTKAGAEKSVFYGRKKTEFIEGETRLIQRRIELNDATVASRRIKSLEKSVQSQG
jgi:hypothetical protein